MNLNQKIKQQASYLSLGPLAAELSPVTPTPFLISPIIPLPLASFLSSYSDFSFSTSSLQCLGINGCYLLSIFFYDSLNVTMCFYLSYAFKFGNTEGATKGSAIYLDSTNIFILSQVSGLGMHVSITFPFPYEDSNLAIWVRQLFIYCCCCRTLA